VAPRPSLADAMGQAALAALEPYGSTPTRAKPGAVSRSVEALPLLPVQPSLVQVSVSRAVRIGTHRWRERVASTMLCVSV
jgi:hypothetical protein